MKPLLVTLAWIVAFAVLSVAPGPTSSEPLRAKPRQWLQSLRWVDTPALSANDVAGKIVVVEFWTFDCINCRRSIPAVRKLAELYRGAPDVVLVGIHTPELDHERDAANVRRAIARLGVTIPVAQDNDFGAWRAFGNRYWPAFYVLDRRGEIRLHHAGELHTGTPAWTRVVGEIDRLRAR